MNEKHRKQMLEDMYEEMTNPEKIEEKRRKYEIEKELKVKKEDTGV